MFKNLISAIKLTLVPVTIAVSTPVTAESSVWKVSKGDHHLFVGGTVHLLPKEEFPLPEEFTQAYKASQSVVLEVADLNMDSPEAQQKMMTLMSYKDGKTLKSVLTDETYQRLGKVCAHFGIPLAQLNNFKPALVFVMLTMRQLAELEMDGDGVDKYFETKAKADNKSLLGLEEVDYQLNLISSMGEGTEEAFIKKSLDDLPKTKQMMANIIKAWRAGDMQTIDVLMGKAMLGYSEKLYQNLLVKRNHNWVPKIEDLLITKEIEFVLVGAGHLAGKDSVLTLLREKGYKVDKL